MLLLNLLKSISSFNIQHIFNHAHLSHSFLFFLFLLNFDLFLFFFQCGLLHVYVFMIWHLLICQDCFVLFFGFISLSVHLVSCIQEDQSFVTVAMM